MVKTNQLSLSFSKTHCLELRTRNLKIKLMFVIITIAFLTPLTQSFWV